MSWFSTVRLAGRHFLVNVPLAGSGRIALHLADQIQVNERAKHRGDLRSMRFCIYGANIKTLDYLAVIETTTLFVLVFAFNGPQDNRQVFRRETKWAMFGVLSPGRPQVGEHQCSFDGTGPGNDGPMSPRR